MHSNIGTDKAVLVRDARSAVFFALAMTSALCSLPSRPRIFFWLGQISTQTLNSMIVPNQEPKPITAMPFVNMNASIMPCMPPPSWANALSPVNQVTAAAIRNHNRALGAMYLLIAAGCGPSGLANAAPTPGT